jgi:hypothetical protein
MGAMARVAEMERSTGLRSHRSNRPPCHDLGIARDRSAGTSQRIAPVAAKVSWAPIRNGVLGSIATRSPRARNKEFPACARLPETTARASTAKAPAERATEGGFPSNQA